jgi:hypothetical protein
MTEDMPREAGLAARRDSRPGDADRWTRRSMACRTEAVSSRATLRIRTTTGRALYAGRKTRPGADLDTR